MSASWHSVRSAQRVSTVLYYFGESNKQTLRRENRDLDANPLIELEETEIGNGQYAPALLFRKIHVEDLFRNIPHERTRLGVPPGYTAWSPHWSDFTILRLRIPIQRPMRIEAPRPRIRLFSSMNSPTDTPSRSPSPVPSYSQIPDPESITPSTRD